MIQLTPTQTATLSHWFQPSGPCWLVGMHLLKTGNGACFANCWPNPAAVLASTADNYALMGQPDSLQPARLKEKITGFIGAPAPFVPLLKETFSDLKVWERLLFELKTSPNFTLPKDVTVRRLVTTDAYHLWGLTPESFWISKTWGGPAGLASSGYGWGAFAGSRLVSVACTFFLGARYEEVGVITEAGFRSRGLSAACAGALCQEIQSRGRTPSWSTSPDNVASVRVAEKLGFSPVQQDRLYVTGIPLPGMSPEKE